MEADKSEHNNLAASEPEIVASLLQRWKQIGEGYLPPPNPALEMDAYCANIERHHGFVAPWTTTTDGSD